MGLRELDSDLQTAEKTLSHWERTYPGLVRADATAKVNFETSWADAITEIMAAVPEGGKAPTVAVLESEATRKCAVQLKAKREAEAEVEIGKKLIGIAETTLTSIQSRLKLEQMEMALSGTRT